MPLIKILIVEDETIITEVLRLYLEKEGYTVYATCNGADGLRLIDEAAPDIVLLDIHLPDQNGLELARKFRKRSNGILIFISGERTQSTIMEGFEIGCDDYITKPFDPPEVVARIKANIRRSGLEASNVITLGDLTVNFTDKSVFKKGEKLDLFTKERMLLFHFVRHPNQIFSAEQLFDLIWGIDSEAHLKTVHVYVSTLRKKIEDDPRHPQYLQTVRGFGYKFSNG